jgi:preprotein translocase subunit Sec63
MKKTMKISAISLYVVSVLLLSCLTTTMTHAAQRRQSSGRQQAPPVDSNDYYAIWGLKKGASSKAIKSAYRKVALKCHPDNALYVALPPEILMGEIDILRTLKMANTTA